MAARPALLSALSPTCLCLLLLAMGACGSDDSSTTEGTPVDAGAEDAGVALDAAAADTEAADSGPFDAGQADTGKVDAGAVDSGAVDSGAVDSGAVDSGSIDAGSTDTGPTDTAQPPPDGGDVAVADGGAPVDGGPADSGPIDGGVQDVQSDAGVVDSGPIDAGVKDAGPPDAGGPPPLWDMPMIADPTTANCKFTNAKEVEVDGVKLRTYDLSYSSWESIGGKLQPITIYAKAAHPADNAVNLPGVVTVHDLGGAADLAEAVSLATQVGVFAVSYSGPGAGTGATKSGGLPANHQGGKRLYDVVPDTRGSWFWAHTVAGMRAISCLSTRKEVNPTSFAATGSGFGGALALIMAGADTRFYIVTSIGGSLGWDLAVKSPQSWHHDMLFEAGYSAKDVHWTKLMDDMLKPALKAASKIAANIMIGTSDEYFPINSHAATYGVMSIWTRHHSLVGNWDKGCYAAANVEPPQVIAKRAAARARGGVNAWFKSLLKTDMDFYYYPMTPLTGAKADGDKTKFTAEIAGGGKVFTAEGATAWWSHDEGFTWQHAEMDNPQSIVWVKTVDTKLLPTSLWFLDIEYSHKKLGPKTFSVSSKVNVGANFVPHLRDKKSCQ